jgi:hypothetical protein
VNSFAQKAATEIPAPLTKLSEEPKNAKHSQKGSEEDTSFQAISGK